MNRNKARKWDRLVNYCLALIRYDQIFTILQTIDVVLMQFSQEISWMRTGTEFSQYLRIFLPIVKVRLMLYRAEVYFETCYENFVSGFCV